jgi:hypothetical protein
MVNIMNEVEKAQQAVEATLAAMEAEHNAKIEAMNAEFDIEGQMATLLAQFQLGA